MEGFSVKNTFIDVCPVDEVCSEDSSPRGSPKRNASAPASPSRRRGQGQEFVSWVNSEHGFENYDVVPPIGSVLRYGANAHLESDEFGLRGGAFEVPFFQPNAEKHPRSSPFGSGLPPPRDGREPANLEGLGLHEELAGQDAGSRVPLGEFASAPLPPAYLANALGEKQAHRNRSRERSQAYCAPGGAGDVHAEWLGFNSSGYMGVDSRLPHGGDCFSIHTYGLPSGPLPTFGGVPLSGVLGDAGDRRPEATRSMGKVTGLDGYQLPSGDAGDRRLQGDAGDRRLQPSVYPMYPGAPAVPFESHCGGPDGFENWMREPQERGRRMGDAGDRASAGGGKGPGRGGGVRGRPVVGGGGSRDDAGRAAPPERGRQQADNRPEKSQPWVAANIKESVLFDDAGVGAAKGMGGGGPKRTDYQKKFGGAGEELDAGAAADAAAGGDRQLITTMMLKNIPCRKSQMEVMTHIDVSGFSGSYDFFYLPCDTKFRANLGYAFVNFVSPREAERFSKEMDGYRFPGSGSNKACAVVPAHVQGLVNNLSAFKRTEVMRSRRKPYFSPLAAA